jgi:hypothetical protein
MFKIKTSIKLLKQVGFVLIALPEPITTPFGAALVITSQCLSRVYESELNRHLRESLKRHLAHRKDSSKPKESPSLWRRRLDAFYSKPVPHAVDIDRLSKRFGENRVQAVVPGASEEEKSAVLHTVNKDQLARRFKPGDNPESKPGTANPLSEKTGVLHTVNKEALANRFKAGETSRPAESDKPGVMHSINRAALSRRFQADENKEAESGSNSPKEKTVVRRRVRARADSQPAESEKAEPIVNLHKIDKAKLSRRFQADENKEAESGSNPAGDNAVVHRRVRARADSQPSESENAEPVVNLHKIDKAGLSRRFQLNENKEKASDSNPPGDKTTMRRRVYAQKDSQESEPEQPEEVTNVHRINKPVLLRRYGPQNVRTPLKI